MNVKILKKQNVDFVWNRFCYDGDISNIVDDVNCHDWHVCDHSKYHRDVVSNRRILHTVYGVFLVFVYSLHVLYIVSSISKITIQAIYHIRYSWTTMCTLQVVSAFASCIIRKMQT